MTGADPQAFTDVADTAQIVTVEPGKLVQRS
jgi:hypothetical protein